MLTNHIQTSEVIYCRLLNRVLPLTAEHFDVNCLGQCPYFVGTVQGMGVECKFDDGTRDGLVHVGTEEGAQRLYHEVQPRIGLKSVTAILTKVKGGVGSGFHGHAGRTGKVGGSAVGGTITLGFIDADKFGLPKGEYTTIWSGKPGAGGRGTAVKKAAESSYFKLVRVGGAYHVIDTTPKPTTPPPPTVSVGFGKGVPAGKYETVYSIPTSKKAAEAKAAKLGPGYVAVRAEGAYHVIKTPLADLAKLGVRTGPSAADVVKPHEVEPSLVRAPKPAPAPTTEIYDKDFPKIPINHKTEAKIMGRLSPERRKEAEKTLEEFKALIHKTDVCVNIPKAVVKNIVEEGFKNQHEVKSSRGTLNPKMRKEAERNAFGEHLTMPKDFPIYGYVDTAKNGYTPGAYQYGDGIRAVLKRDVHERTTVTAMDSLSPFKYGEAIGTPKLAPRIASLSSVIGVHPPVRSYVEAQIHGGLGASDIHKFQVIPKFERENPGLITYLKEKGYTVETFDFHYGAR